MKNSVRSQSTLELLFNIFFIVIEASLYIFLIIYLFEGKIEFYLKGYMVSFLVYSIILSTFLYIYDGYKLTFSKVSDVIWSVSLAIIISGTLSYLQNSLIANELLNFNKIILVILLQLAVGVFIIFFEWKILYKIFPPKSTILIYENGYKDIYKKLKKKMEILILI